MNEVEKLTVGMDGDTMNPPTSLHATNQLKASSKFCFLLNTSELREDACKVVPGMTWVPTDTRPLLDNVQNIGVS